MDHTVAFDRLRYTCIAQALGLIILVLVVNVYYHLFVGKIRGRLKPLHVTMISASYIMLLCFNIYLLIIRLGNPELNFWTPFFSVIFLVGMIAMFLIAISILKQYYQHKEDDVEKARIRQELDDCKEQ